MKVAMIGWEYPPWFSGGLGIHCQAIVRELAALGVYMDFYLPADPNTPFVIPEQMKMHCMDITNSNSTFTYNSTVTWMMVQEFRVWLEASFNPEEVDIIHAHDWMGVFAAARISEIHHIPLVWTVHSTEYDRAAGMPPHPGIIAVEQEAFRQVQHTIAVSKRTKRSLVERYGADPANITVIYNGLDSEPFERLADRDYQAEDGYILFLGRITQQKGPEHFLEAARLVLRETDARFMIAGDGDLLGILRRRARRWQIDDRVQFTGRITGDELLDCYRNAILYVLPSVSEPFGITVLEAMASGVPTVISNATGAGEIVKYAVEVKAGDPKELARTLLILLGNPRLRETLGRNGALEARKWTWRRAARKTYALYQQIYDGIQF